MKKFLYILVPVLTFVCGFFIRGMFMDTPVIEKEEIGIQKVHKEHIDSSINLGEKSILDSEKKKSELALIKTEEVEESTDTLMVVDTLGVVVDSSIVYEDSIRIGRERRMKSMIYQIRKKSRLFTSLDSLKDKGLNIREESFGKKILVEFWESPINYTGYKLGKSKLVLYGINPESKIQLEELGKDSLRLLEGDVLFNFVKTEEFKPLVVVMNDTL